MDSLPYLNRRRSVPSRLLGEPGPDAAQLDAMLAAAVRVPDHGKLVPWRFLRIQGPARQALGELLVARGRERDPDAPPAAVEKDRLRFSFAPLVIAVIGHPTPGHKVPVQEQLLTGGSVCFALLQAAQGLGFGAQWLTGWAAYDPVVTARLGLTAGETVLGFIHIGTPSEQAPERQRPDPRALLTDWIPVTGPVHLVDASLYVFRAWHSMPPEFQDRDGWPVNAVHGFARFLLELLERQKPVRIAVAFDESLDSNFRNGIYPAYKANRDPAPEELRRQFAHCQRLCRALGLAVLTDGRYEADDLIGAALGQVRRAGHAGLIISADKDLSQLLDGHDEQWDYARNERWRADGVMARYGVHAHQIADYLGLTGDAIDNIPGVPGIGAKTAALLLAHFGTLDALLDRLAEVPYLRMRGSSQHARRLGDHREMALLSRRLATIDIGAPLPDDLGTAERRAPDASSLVALCEELRFGPLTRRRLLSA